MDKELAKDDKVEERMDIGNNENAVIRSQGGSEGQEMSDDSEQQANANEITQTDHLNKKLLEAFLTKINSSIPDNSSVPGNCPLESTEWTHEGKG